MNKILLLKHWQLFLLVVLTGLWVSPSPLKEIINMISVIIFTVWAYTIVTRGEELGFHFSELSFFKINIIFILAFTTVSLFISDALENSVLILFLTLFSLYLFFAIFYCIYTVAKMIKTIELNRDAKFEDYMGYLILICFFFIGVWILQPKINTLFSENNSHL